MQSMEILFSSLRFSFLRPECLFNDSLYACERIIWSLSPSPGQRTREFIISWAAFFMPVIRVFSISTQPLLHRVPFSVAWQEINTLPSDKMRNVGAFLWRNAIVRVSRISTRNNDSSRHSSLKNGRGLRWIWNFGSSLRFLYLRIYCVPITYTNSSSVIL